MTHPHSIAPARRVRHGGAAGFTLIEVMIVVAIVAILAAIALPSYVESVRKGKRAQGRTALVQLMQQQERYFTQNNSYLAWALNSTTATDASSNSVTVPFQTTSGDNGSATPAYKLSAAACSGSTLRECVVLTATNQFSDPYVTTLTLTSTGAKGCSTDTTAHQTLCWN